MKRKLLALILAAAAFPAVPQIASGQEAAPAAGGAPQVFLDKNPKIVAYQLKRLSNAQLLAVERKTDHPKYKPVFEAILTRKNIDKKQREEAVAALVTLNKSDPVTELLAAVGRVEEGDTQTVRELASSLTAQQPAAIAAQGEKLESLAKGSESPLVRQSAFAALATSDAEKAWTLATATDGGLRLLLRGVPTVSDPKALAALYPRVKPLVTQAPDEETQLAAIDAVSYLPGNEAEAFKLLAGLVKGEAGPRRDAAVRSIQRVPAAKWPADEVEPLARAAVKIVEQTPSDQRLSPAVAQAVQLGNDLAAALPEAAGKDVKKSLRELGVRTVVIRAYKEQMLYDLRYFVVQAGKPVQIVLDNTDVMPHNVVITAPGAVEEIGVAGGAQVVTPRPGEKPFVPKNNKKVIAATNLVAPEESDTLSFVAPAEPGEYGYVCTFPGHWVRMYGVMLVVPDLEAWEQNPKHPADPITKKPMDSQKHDPAGAGPAVHHH